MGLGTQMLGWHEDFCEQLAGRGFHVVRFDNRDVGRSTHTDGPVPSLVQLITRSARPATYTLADMAADAVGLLDHLGVERAHVVGASMGGMIAQTIAARHPGRVLSLVSIMSNTGSRFTGQPAFSVVPLMIKAAPSDRDGYAEHVVSIFAAVGSPGFPRDDDEVRELARRSWDRSYDPAGSGRQLAAINASGNRRAEIRRDLGADARDPREGRQARAPLGRDRHRAADRRRADHADRGHGARPAARRLAADRRRHRRHRRAGRLQAAAGGRATGLTRPHRAIAAKR